MNPDGPFKDIFTGFFCFTSKVNTAPAVLESEALASTIPLSQHMCKFDVKQNM